MKQASLAVLALVVLLAVLALGQTPPQTFAEQRIQLLEKKVSELEVQVADLKQLIKPQIPPAKP